MQHTLPTTDWAVAVQNINIDENSLGVIISLLNLFALTLYLPCKQSEEIKVVYISLKEVNNNPKTASLPERLIKDIQLPQASPLPIAPLETKEEEEKKSKVTYSGRMILGNLSDSGMSTLLRASIIGTWQIPPT